MPIMFPKPTRQQAIADLVQSGVNAGSADRASEDRRVVRGQVVLTPEGPMPYKVILHYREDSEHPFETMRASEAFIRSECPMPISTTDGRQAPDDIVRRPASTKKPQL
jgi:hypothetical protein